MGSAGTKAQRGQASLQRGSVPCSLAECLAFSQGSRSVPG